MESSDQFRRRSTRKGKKFFVIGLGLSDHQVLYNIASSSSFFFISLGFSRFLRSYFVLPISWSLRDLIKQLVPFALVGYETGYTISYLTRAHGIIFNYTELTEESVV